MCAARRNRGSIKWGKAEIGLIVDTETPLLVRIITREWLGASAALASYRLGSRVCLPKSHLIPWRPSLLTFFFFLLRVYVCTCRDILRIILDPRRGLWTWNVFARLDTDDRRVRLCDSYLDIVGLINFLRWLRGLDLWLSMRGWGGCGRIRGRIEIKFGKDSFFQTY